jgi:hypothetical protein
MKSLLKSSLVLIVFSFSIIIFNISCEKTAEAQLTTPVSGVQNVGLVFFNKYGDKDNEFWKANFDGSNQVKIAIAALPAGMQIDKVSLRVSPDGQKVFFNLYNASLNQQNMYSCNIDGSGIKKIIDQVDYILQVI